LRIISHFTDPSNSRTSVVDKSPYHALTPDPSDYNASDMATIDWHNRSDAWVVAGWAFRQVLEDVRSQCPTDAEMISEVELARELKYLFIDTFSSDLAKRMAKAIRDTATGIQSGSNTPVMEVANPGVIAS
jgi:hypothetical protein